MAHTSKLTKKGKNPGAVDSWLDTLGFYRKNVAYDETCLFRAVSEQLFDVQIYHERVRTECIEHARHNYEAFGYYFDSEDEWNQHIDKLEKHMVICGNIEIQMISYKYDRDVIVFDAAHQEVHDVTKRNLNESLLLCLMSEEHYDAVYKREHIATAGFCQSIAYKLLYENVFHIQNVDEIVNGMLYDKTYITTQAEVPSDETKLKEIANNNCVEEEIIKVEDSANNRVISQISTVRIAPFPFKVAKALDPNMYRNIEYDSWTEVRREMRLGDWYYGDDKLILGTRCILNDLFENEKYDCYIQDIIKDENKCVVYVTKLAQKRIVNYTDLSPESDAKPWPLPYRFSKNLILTSTNGITSSDKIHLKSPKKKKDKKRNKSSSESSVLSNSVQLSVSLEHDVNAYVGVPLQMHTSQELQEDSCLVTSASDMMTQTPTTPRFQLENPFYSYPSVIFPTTPEPMSWPQSPINPFDFNARPVVSSLPASPSVHYYNVNYPNVYNYPVEQYNYTYQSWPNTPSDCTSPYVPDNICCKDIDTSRCVVNETNNNQTLFVESACDNQQNNDQVVCNPVSPMVGMYSPMITLPPGTPVIYSPSPEMSGMMLPTTPIPMYSSPIPYGHAEHYSYPPTPHTGWYPPGINTQGFIYPTPNIQTVPK